MRLLLFSVILVGLFLLPLKEVKAIECNAYSTFYSFLHFSKGSKKIKNVMAHVGSKILYSHSITKERKIIWQDVKNVVLEDKGDHFFGKVSFKSTEQGGGVVNLNLLAPVVQYWVDFEDGTTVRFPEYDGFPITDRNAHRFTPSTNSRERERFEMLKRAFSHTNDHDKTEIVLSTRETGC